MIREKGKPFFISWYSSTHTQRYCFSLFFFNYILGCYRRKEDQQHGSPSMRRYYFFFFFFSRPTDSQHALWCASTSLPRNPARIEEEETILWTAGKKKTFFFFSSRLAHYQSFRALPRLAQGSIRYNTHQGGKKSFLPLGHSVFSLYGR